MTKMNVHAVIGTGTAPEKVIIEGLNDAISATDTIGLVWLGKPNATTEVVYDYVLDNELSFVMYYADDATPPRLFRESDKGFVQKVRNPHQSALAAVEGKGKVLYLWDDADDDQQIEPIFGWKPAGALVLELTNGLSPISIDVDIPEPVDSEVAKQVEEEKEDDTHFTKDELQMMTPAAVKRYGERMETTSKTKGGIIAELFPEVPEEGDEVTEQDPTDEAPAADVVVPGKTPQMIGQDEEKFMRSLTNITPSAEVIVQIEDLRAAAKKYGMAIFEILNPSRERSLALTHLEDSLMWAVKSIVLESE